MTVEQIFKYYLPMEFLSFLCSTLLVSKTLNNRNCMRSYFHVPNTHSIPDFWNNAFPSYNKGTKTLTLELHMSNFYRCSLPQTCIWNTVDISKTAMSWTISLVNKYLFQLLDLHIFFTRWQNLVLFIIPTISVIM